MAAVEFAEFYPPLGMFGGPGLPWPLSSGVDPIDLAAHRGKDLLLIAQPADPTAGPALGLYGPLGSELLPEDMNWGWRGLPTTLYVACTTGRSSANDDEPAATPVPGGLRPPAFGQSLFSGIDPANAARAGEGVIEIDDKSKDGNLDHLFAYVWDSAPLILRRGVRGTPFSTWPVVARFRAAGLHYDLDAKQIHLKDLGWQLSGLLHGQYFKGTGGIEGDSDKKGVWIPWALGYCFNCPPVRLSSTSNIVRWSVGSSQALLELRHGAIPLPIHGDYPTFEALDAATDIPSGEVGTCLAKSCARPNITITRSIRVDVIGDNDTAYGHPAPLTRSAIARRIATTRGTSRLDDNAEIDMAAFNRMAQRHTAPVGWYFDQQISKADALDRVLAGILGTWRVSPSGHLVVGWMSTPRVGSSLTMRYKAEGMGLPRMGAWAPPRAGTHVSWKWNYGREARADLAELAEEDVVALVTRDAGWAPSLSPAVSALYPTAKIVKVAEAGFWLEADAVLEVNRQQGLLEILRKRWQWDHDIDPYADLLGSGYTLIDANREGPGGTTVSVLGLGDSTPLVIVAQDAPGNGLTGYDFWG